MASTQSSIKNCVQKYGEQFYKSVPHVRRFELDKKKKILEYNFE